MGRRLIVQENPQEIPLQELTQRINTANLTLEEIETEIENKKEGLDGLDVLMETSNNSLKRYQEAELAHREVLSTVTDEVINKKNELNELQNRLDEMTFALEDTQDKITESENKVRELAKQAGQYEETARVKANEVVLLTEKRATLESLIATGEKDVQAKHDEAMGLVETANQLSLMIVGKREAVEALNIEIADLEVKKNEASEAVSVQINTLADTKLKQTVEDTILSQKKEEVFAVEQEIIQLREEKAGVMTMLDEKIAYLKRLKEDLENKGVIGE